MSEGNLFLVFNLAWQKRFCCFFKKNCLKMIA